MLNNINTLDILGGNFAELIHLDLFECKKNIKATILYGRNGTGKSTIARAFKKLKGERMDAIYKAEVCSSDGNHIELSEEDKNHIFVFDEEFVYKNVRLKEDHLETLVMLGEEADLSRKLETAIGERDKAREEYELEEKQYKEYLDVKNPKSPLFQKNKIMEALRGDDSWSGRDRLIKGTRQNTRVVEDGYKRFINLSPSKVKMELLEEFSTNLRMLRNAESGANLIKETVPKICSIYKDFDDEGLIDCLNKVIDRPILTEREKRMMSIVESGSIARLTEIVKTFKKEEVTECPYCFRKIDQDYKGKLVNSIEKVLSKKVEEHREELNRRIEIEELKMDLTPFEKLDNCEECVGLMNKINHAIQYYQTIVKDKLDNPYETQSVSGDYISVLSSRLAKCLEKLEKERCLYNLNAKKTSPIIEKLNEINNSITYYEIISFVNDFNKQSSLCEVEKKYNERLKNVLKEKEKVVIELEAKKRNVRIASGFINACLSYVFFSNERLSIEYADAGYKLKAHGKAVKPCDISVGERNILGLCYFFANILEGKEESEAYKDEYLIVIDDPISSYDAENRIGITSFLKYQLGKFLVNNKNTRTLLMTHDMSAFFDVMKVFEEILKICKDKGYSSKDKPLMLRLFDGVKKFEVDKQEYTELIKYIYAYATGESTDADIVIGNMMRQVLEAFSTFQYRKGIEAVSNDDNILELLECNEYKVYYKNLMYRLLLNGGSHRSNQVKYMQDLRFFPLLSDVEKRKTAKDILCFIYILNRSHLLSHLDTSSNAATLLDNWCQDIKSATSLK